MALEGNILIGTPGAIPTPPAGEVTRFLDTTYSPPKLSYKDETGNSYPFPIDSAEMAEDCCCEIAKDIADKASCALAEGIVSMADFNTFVKQGVTVLAKSTDDGAGNTTCSVSISALFVAATGLSVSPTSIVPLATNSSQTIFATLAPANATDRTIIWTSSNSGVAAVSSNGTVTGISAGTAVITATSVNGGFTATCNVTVV